MFSDEIVTLNHKKKITGKKYIFLAAFSIKGIDDQSHKFRAHYKLSVQLQAHNFIEYYLELAFVVVTYFSYDF